MYLYEDLDSCFLIKTDKYGLETDKRFLEISHFLEQNLMEHVDI